MATAGSNTMFLSKAEYGTSLNPLFLRSHGFGAFPVVSGLVF